MSPTCPGVTRFMELIAKRDSVIPPGVHRAFWCFCWHDKGGWLKNMLTTYVCTKYGIIYIHILGCYPLKSGKWSCIIRIHHKKCDSPGDDWTTTTTTTPAYKFHVFVKTNRGSCKKQTLMPIGGFWFMYICPENKKRQNHTYPEFCNGCLQQLRIWRPDLTEKNISILVYMWKLYYIYIINSKYTNFILSMTIDIHLKNSPRNTLDHTHTHTHTRQGKKWTTLFTNCPFSPCENLLWSVPSSSDYPPSLATQQFAPIGSPLEFFRKEVVKDVVFVEECWGFVVKLGCKIGLTWNLISLQTWNTIRV